MAKIGRLITTAWHYMLPVYNELPSDVGYLDIEGSGGPAGAGRAAVMVRTYGRSVGVGEDNFGE